eukprot:4122529-Pleurochrysis_carterae.AAC.2
MAHQFAGGSVPHLLPTCSRLTFCGIRQRQRRVLVSELISAEAAAADAASVAAAAQSVAVSEADATRESDSGADADVRK